MVIKIQNNKAIYDIVNNEVKYIKMLQKLPVFPIIFNSLNLYVSNNKHIIIEFLLDTSLY